MAEDQTSISIKKTYRWPKRKKKKEKMLNISIREMQIKTSIRHPLIPARMASNKMSTNNKSWRRCAEKGTILHCWLECKLVQALQKRVWSFLKKFKKKIELPYDPAIPILGIYPEKTMTQKDTCTPMFTATLYTIAKTWKPPRCPLT